MVLSSFLRRLRMKALISSLVCVVGVLTGCASPSPCCQQDWYSGYSCTGCGQGQYVPSSCTSCGQVTTTYAVNYQTRTVYRYAPPAPACNRGYSCQTAKYDCGSSCIHWRTGCWAHYACNSYE